MGLLDSLGYGGGSGGGGLLDFLLQQPPQAFSGLPSDQAQYGQQPMNAMAQAPQSIFGANQPSPLDNASWPAGPVGAPQQNAQPSPLDTAQWPHGPIGAPSQANAQMIPQQPPPVISGAPAPPPAAAQGPGIGDRLMAGMQGFANSGGLLPALANGIGGLATGKRMDPTGVAEQQTKQVQNQTLQALLQKGIDPQTAQAAIGNPEMLKALITQAYGPQTVTSLGNGYVADKAGNIKRAYTPDDKTPTSALEYNFYKENLAKGETPLSYSRWMATKDTDPSKPYVLGRGGEIVQNGPDGKPVILHKNEDGGGDAASIDDKTAKLLAERVLMGDTKALTGLGRGAQGAANILKIHKLASDIAEEKGLDAKGILSNVAQQAGLVSSARALGTKETHFGVAEKAMEESLPLAQAASDAVPRSDWIHLNKLVQMGQTEHSNPLLKRFLIATDTAAKDYARTINPTGALRESDIEYARKILSTADGPESYTAALDQLRMEAGVMHRAISRQKGELYGKKEDHTPDAPATTGKTKTGVSWGLVK